jgi:hypothetical protein
VTTLAVKTPLMTASMVHVNSLTPRSANPNRRAEGEERDEPPVAGGQARAVGGGGRRVARQARPGAEAVSRVERQL